jgi:hypothetical protein
MAVILAFDVVALSIARVSAMGKPGASADSANVALGRFASTEVASHAVYHRMGDCHATPIFSSLQTREGSRTRSRPAGGMPVNGRRQRFNQENRRLVK